MFGSSHNPGNLQKYQSEAIKCGVEGVNTSYKLLFKCNEKAEQFSIYFSVDQKAISSQRSRVNEFLTRANYGLNIGNFEMDFQDGEIRFKTAIDVEECVSKVKPNCAPQGELSLKMISNFVGFGIRTFDRYYPGIMSVMFAQCDPKLEIDKAEGRIGEAQPVLFSSTLPTSTNNGEANGDYSNVVHDDDGDTLVPGPALPRAVRASSITAHQLPEATVFFSPSPASALPPSPPEQNPNQ